MIGHLEAQGVLERFCVVLVLFQEAGVQDLDVIRVRVFPPASASRKLSLASTANWAQYDWKFLRIFESTLSMCLISYPRSPKTTFDVCMSIPRCLGALANWPSPLVRVGLLCLRHPRDKTANIKVRALLPGRCA